MGVFIEHAGKYLAIGDKIKKDVRGNRKKKTHKEQH